MTRQLRPVQIGALLALLAAAPAAGGCARLRARSTPAPPVALDVPPPPPRSVEEIGGQQTPGPGVLVDEQQPNIPTRPRQTTAPGRTDPRPADPPKSDPAIAQEPPPIEGPRQPPASTLQTAPPEREAELERGIRGLLSRAAADLNRVDYQRLNTDARAQYDQAKRFAEQAEEALRAKNLLFAENLADKAATLATQLAGR
jgi:hypothetical protein